MLRLIIIENVFDTNCEDIEVDNICEYLYNRYPSMPDNAKIYKSSISESNDVTPKTEKDIEELSAVKEGSYIFVNYPDGLSLVTLLIVAVVVVVVAVVLLVPSIPKADENSRNLTSKSNQNNLASRSNSPRPLSRIPDIYGTVKSIPDLISQVLIKYVADRQVEISQMVIGRGEYNISSIRDGDTLIKDISGSSLQIYGPNTSASTGDNPQISIGSHIDYPVFTSRRSNEVNGQELIPPNLNSFKGTNNIIFGPEGLEVDTTFEGSEDGDLDFREYFSPYDTVFLRKTEVNIQIPFASNTRSAEPVSDGLIFTGFNPSEFYVPGDSIVLTDSTGSPDLSGTYIVESVSSTKATLQNPELVVADWSSLSAEPEHTFLIVRAARSAVLDLNGTYEVLEVGDNTIEFINPSVENKSWNSILATSGNQSEFSTAKIKGASKENWIGEFFLGEIVKANIVVLNFVAPKGLYKDDGEQQFSVTVDLLIEITPCDSEGNSVSSTVVYETSIRGSSRLKSLKAKTLEINPPGFDFYKVRVRRTSERNEDFEGTVVDEVRWADCFALKEHNNRHFGDVTSIVSETFSTAGAQSIKDRKLNMMVTRRLPRRDSSGEPGLLSGTSNPRRIIPSIFEDPVIGNRPLSQLDFASLDKACDDVKDHFGTDIPLNFGDTFDSVNISMEEMITSIASVCFIKVFRKGDIIFFEADIPSKDPVLLFNHRNKVPGTEKRTTKFGTSRDYDGVRVEWRDINGEPQFFQLPNDNSVKYKTVNLIGVSEREHAILHAWRIWNKMLYQRVSVSFDALQEAALISTKDLVLVADNTRSDTITGEIISQNGLILKVSSTKLIPEIEFSCYIQFSNGLTQSIDAIGISGNEIMLVTEPSYAINTQEGSYAKSQFVVVLTPEDRTSSRMIVGKKTAKDGFIYSLELINEDPRYYNNDQMFSE